MQLPTVESLTAQISQMILQRSQAKDQIEQIERVLPVLQGQLQLLQAQEQAAQEAVVAED